MALPMPKKNSVKTTIAAPGIDADDTTIPVTDLSVFYDKDGNLITEGIEIGFLNSNDTLPEEITITGASGTSGAGNLTGATRGVNADGSIGAGHAWDTGTEIAVMFTTGVYLHIRDAIGDWDDFDPNPTWGTADPTITSAVARYVRTGNLVTFAVSFVISDGNAASSLTMALPVAAAQTANYQIALTAFKKITLGGDSIMSDPFAYIDYTEATPIIKFNQFGTLPSGYTAVLNISGSYEVPES